MEEDYKQRYENLIESLKRAKETKGGYTFKSVVDEFVPELKESEGERIRKAIFKALSKKDARDVLLANGIQVSDALSWLEKQGHDGKKWIYEDVYIKEKEQVFQDGVTEVLENPQKYGLEKQGEQKPTDKVEPKFKVGDWIIYNKNIELANSLMLVTGKDNNEYLCKYIDGQCSYNIESIDTEYHLWTIQDAKDGDVLAVDWHEHDDSWEKIIIFKKYYNNGVKGLLGSPCVEGYGNTFKNGQLVFSEEVPYYSKTWTAYLHPATKEQRDFLFQKMHEAGYEWDDKKKELRKVEQNPSWSEEDESKFKFLYHLLEQNLELHGSYSFSDVKELGFVTKQEALDMLKSFKERYTWKPSDEQMDALNLAIGEARSVDTAAGDEAAEILTSLYEQLEKLKQK